MLFTASSNPRTLSHVQSINLFYIMRRSTTTQSLIFLTFLTIFCLGNSREFNVSTANLSDLRLCSEIGDASFCETGMTSFSPGAPQFVATSKLGNAPSGTKVSFHWYYLGDEKILIDSVVYEGESGYVRSWLSKPQQGWPEGTYEIVAKIQTDNAEPLSKQFEVVGAM